MATRGQPTPEASDTCVLALNQGLRASRAVVFDRDGAQLARGTCESLERRPRQDYVEQDAEEIVASIRAALAEGLYQLGDRADTLASAGLATQRSSIVCWDRLSGEALSPVLSWEDRRARNWAARFAPRSQDIRARTGLFLSPRYGASKMRWCLDHLPSVQTALAEERLALGPLATFLAFRLLDEHPFTIDPVNASRTLLWNVRTLDWDPELLALFCIPLSVLPRCVPTRHAVGALDIGARKVPLAVLTGDPSAAIFAGGRPRADTAYVDLGLRAFVHRPVGGDPPELERLLASIALVEDDGPTYVAEGLINGAASALHWIAGEFGVEDVEARLEGWLREDRLPPLFLNGVAGLAAPYWMPRFRSHFVGQGDAAEKVIAVAESVLFLVQAILEEMDRGLPKVERLRVSGSLARIDALCQRLADLTDLPVHRNPEPDATARGVAWLLHGDRARWPEIEDEVRFEPREDPLLRARHRAWRSAMDRALSQRR